MRTILQTIVILFLFTLQTSAADTTLTSVKLQLKWKHQFQFAGYYAAIEKGYYKDAGLKVELIEVADNQPPFSTVINGDADFGISTSDVVLLRANGNSVVVLAEIFQHSAQILLATKSSGIKHVHDIVGKKLMIEPHIADLIAYINDEGIYLKKEDNIQHSFDVNLLINNNIDAMTAYSTDEPFVLSEHGVDYNIISPLSGGIDFYGDVLITTEQLLLERPELAIKFRDASIKGWKYAMNNSNEIVDLIYTKYSKRHSKEHLAFEAQKMQHLINADIIEIGYSNEGRWQRIIEIYKQVKMLDNNFDINGLLYTDYLKREIVIPWKLIGIFGLGLIIFGLITLFFYNLSQKLKSEIENRDKTRKILVESRKELLKTNKKLQQLSLFKEDMTNMIVHDLKAPLSTIINAKLIKDDNNGIALVQQSGYKMLNLVENILNVYKYENTKFELNKSNVSLINIIDSAIEEVLFLANQKSLKIDKSKSLNCEIIADADIIRRVFVNLLSNAVKFSPSGSIININTVAKPDNAIKISVINQGVGISKEKQKLIFERFGQAHKVNTGKIGSTGLGLTFCKMAVEAHGGAIEVISEEDKNTEFWFTLPNSFVSLTKAKNDKELDTNISNSNKEYLTPFVNELEKLKIFEITSINKVLAKITSESPEVKNWLSQITQATESGNSIEYNKLTSI